MCICFWKDFHKLSLLFKKIKISNLPERIVSLRNSAHVFPLAMLIIKIFFCKKKSTHVFRHCYVQHIRNISGKSSKPYFNWKFLFLKQKTWFSNNYFDKAIVTVQGNLQEESEIPVSRTLWKELQEVKRKFLTCFRSQIMISKAFLWFEETEKSVKEVRLIQRLIRTIHCWLESWNGYCVCAIF